MIWPARYHLSNVYCLKKIKKKPPIVIARWSISDKHQHGRLGVIIPLRLRCPKSISFLCSRNENFGKSSIRFQLQVGSPWIDLAEIWPAYCQIVFLENHVGDFCFLFPFSNKLLIVIFSKEALMICPLWLYPIAPNEQMHVSKIWDTVF